MLLKCLIKKHFKIYIQLTKKNQNILKSNFSRKDINNICVHVFYLCFQVSVLSVEGDLEAVYCLPSRVHRRYFIVVWWTRPVITKNSSKPRRIDQQKFYKFEDKKLFLPQTLISFVALWGTNRNSCFQELSRPSKCVNFNVGYLHTYLR